MEQPLVEETSKDTSAPSNVEKWCEITYYLVWALIYWLALNQTEYLECPDPVWSWSHYAKYYFTAATILTFVCYIGLPYLLSKSSDSISNIGMFVILLILTIMRVLSLGVTVGMTISFFQREECPSLSMIILIQFFLSIVPLGLIVLSLIVIYISLAITVMRPGDHSETKAALNKSANKSFLIMFPIMRYSKNAKVDSI